MTAEEVYQSVTNGGTSGFAAAVKIFEGFGPWCLIGGLAVNSYVEPVYTVDADFVIVSANLSRVSAALDAAGFSLQTFAHSVNARRPESQLSLQLTTDPRDQDFPERAERQEVLGVIGAGGPGAGSDGGKGWEGGCGNHGGEGEGCAGVGHGLLQRVRTAVANGI